MPASSRPDPPANRCPSAVLLAFRELALSAAPMRLTSSVHASVWLSPCTCHFPPWTSLNGRPTNVQLTACSFMVWLDLGCPPLLDKCCPLIALPLCHRAIEQSAARTRTTTPCRLRLRPSRAAPTVSARFACWFPCLFCCCATPLHGADSLLLRAGCRA